MTATISNRSLGTTGLKRPARTSPPVKPAKAESFERGDWVTLAVCRAGDPDALFVRGAEQRKAAAICRRCPVQMECRADALDNKVEFGVWGGLTERQRRAVLRKNPHVKDWAAHLAAGEEIVGL